MRRTEKREGKALLLLFVILLPLCAFAKKPKEKKPKMARYYLQHAGTGYVSWAHDSAMNPGTSAFSVSLWAKGVIQLGKAETGGDSWSISTYLNQAIVGAGGSIFYTTTSTTDLDDGNWHHIVFTRDSSYLLSLYVDGSLENTYQSSSVDIDNTEILRTTATNTGSIDEIRIYNGVALSALQVSNIYNSGIGVRVKENGFSKITSNGFYASCDDGSGTTVTGRKITSGTWSAHNGSFTSGDLTWVSGGVPFNSQQLTSDYEEYTYYINRTSKRIQFRFQGREDLEIREFKVLKPQVLGNR